MLFEIIIFFSIYFLIKKIIERICAIIIEFQIQEKYILDSNQKSKKKNKKKQKVSS